MDDPRLMPFLEHVEVLRRLDRGRDVFGAKRHHWQVQPPLGEEPVATLEQDLGYALPAGYRTYLTAYGNGGAGPLFGIRTFPAHLSATERASLRRPFPGMAAVHRQVAAGGVDVDADGYFEVDDDALLERLLNGTWRIADDGCGHHARIVLHGAEPGTILTVALEGGIRDTGQDFLDWSLSWVARHRECYEAVWERMLRAEPPDDLVTVNNAALVAALCGTSLGLNGSGNGRRDTARELYRRFLAERGQDPC
ncbi:MULTISPECIES: hypothetical protein [Catenuloplanes]|uniref:Knr4/Smi1-like domain-containing protein n=1 Tax=Catenuloplanes niger TaxID=587534 RepID=A0AAE3ZH68_9ACTN|nr:hypothetical protein [Catenuloplanes niger]MDR7319882.1 hypothetical protein [Catenuloplanes niger]